MLTAGSFGAGAFAAEAGAFAAAAGLEELALFDFGFLLISDFRKFVGDAAFGIALGTEFGNAFGASAFPDFDGLESLLGFVIEGAKLLQLALDVKVILHQLRL